MKACHVDANHSDNCESTAILPLHLSIFCTCESVASGRSSTKAADCLTPITRRPGDSKIGTYQYQHFTPHSPVSKPRLWNIQWEPDSNRRTLKCGHQLRTESILHTELFPFIRSHPHPDGPLACICANIFLGQSWTKIWRIGQTNGRIEETPYEVTNLGGLFERNKVKSKTPFNIYPDML